MPEKYAAILDRVADTVYRDEPELGVRFPYVTAPNGGWDLMFASKSAGYDGSEWSHGNWFCGFWVGLLTIAHLHTGDSKYLDLARERMTLVAPRRNDPNTHDIGFIFLSSAIPLHAVTGDDAFARTALMAAEKLRARLVRTPRGAYISSWGPHSDIRGRKSSAIDTMANLRLLYWAADYSGDESFRVAGALHADMTARNFIRDDFTTFHAVDYDCRTGEPERRYTFQGYADTSAWSRGQSWAVLGFAETAAATGEAHYLDLAAQLAHKYLDLQGSQPISPWDFSDPAGAKATRDSSAQAIVARGLLQMSRLEDDKEKAALWRNAAEKLANALIDHALTTGEQRGVLAHACYSRPHGIGTDSAALFGDYYFCELLCEMLHPGRLYAPGENRQ